MKVLFLSLTVPHAVFSDDSPSHMSEFKQNELKIQSLCPRPSLMSVLKQTSGSAAVSRRFFLCSLSCFFSSVISHRLLLFALRDAVCVSMKLSVHC